MIKVEHLTKRRGARAVVSNVTFRCEPGTVTGFLGPNGAGKTTTMRMLTRAELLTESGTIVEAADLAVLGAALNRAGVAMHPADGERGLVEAEPEVVARVAMANDVVLRRLEPADDAGIERLCGVPALIGERRSARGVA